MRILPRSLPSHYKRALIRTGPGYLLVQTGLHVGMIKQFPLNQNLRAGRGGADFITGTQPPVFTPISSWNVTRSGRDEPPAHQQPAAGLIRDVRSY